MTLGHAGCSTGQNLAIDVPANPVAQTRHARIGGQLHLPPGQGRVPVMILLHGSGGIVGDHMARYTGALNEMGIGALVIDSFGSRGFRQTGENQALLSNYAMTVDAYSALDALRANPHVDIGRVGILGFSKGGTAALLAAERPYQPPRPPEAPGFALHVAFYPGCSWLHRRPVLARVPIRILMGEQDDYVGTQACRRWVERMRALGGDVAMTEYPGGHNFDGYAAAYRNTYLWNFSRCVYEEQEDGTWREETSGVSGIRTPHNVAIDSEDRQQAVALRGCKTMGASGGGNPSGRNRSMEDFRRIVRELL